MRRSWFSLNGSTYTYTACSQTSYHVFGRAALDTSFLMSARLSHISYHAPWFGDLAVATGGPIEPLKVRYLSRATWTCIQDHGSCAMDFGMSRLRVLWRSRYQQAPASSFRSPQVLVSWPFLRQPYLKACGTWQQTTGLRTLVIVARDLLCIVQGWLFIVFVYVITECARVCVRVFVVSCAYSLVSTRCLYGHALF